MTRPISARHADGNPTGYPGNGEPILSGTCHSI